MPKGERRPSPRPLRHYDRGGSLTLLPPPGFRNNGGERKKEGRFAGAKRRRKRDFVGACAEYRATPRVVQKGKQISLAQRNVLRGILDCW